MAQRFTIMGTVSNERSKSVDVNGWPPQAQKAIIYPSVTVWLQCYGSLVHWTGLCLGWVQTPRHNMYLYSKWPCLLRLVLHTTQGSDYIALWGMKIGTIESVKLFISVLYRINDFVYWTTSTWGLKTEARSVENEIWGWHPNAWKTLERHQTRKHYG